jgi:hypothetical protein
MWMQTLTAIRQSRHSPVVCDDLHRPLGLGRPKLLCAVRLRLSKRRQSAQFVCFVVPCPCLRHTLQQSFPAEPAFHHTAAHITRMNIAVWQHDAEVHCCRQSVLGACLGTDIATRGVPSTGTEDIRTAFATGAVCTIAVALIWAKSSTSLLLDALVSRAVGGCSAAQASYSVLSHTLARVACLRVALLQALCHHVVYIYNILHLL